MVATASRRMTSHYLFGDTLLTLLLVPPCQTMDSWPLTALQHCFKSHAMMEDPGNEAKFHSIIHCSQLCKSWPWKLICLYSSQTYQVNVVGLSLSDMWWSEATMMVLCCNIDRGIDLNCAVEISVEIRVVGDVGEVRSICSRGCPLWTGEVKEREKVAEVGEEEHKGRWGWEGKREGKNKGDALIAHKPTHTMYSPRHSPEWFGYGYYIDRQISIQVETDADIVQDNTHCGV